MYIDEWLRTHEDFGLEDYSRCSQSDIMAKRWIWALFIATGLFAAGTWWIGSQLTEPANHAVTRPEGFYGDLVSIPSEDHAIAGWWTETGNRLPVVLLLHAVRADRSTMVVRAQLLQKHGFSTLIIDLQAHGETPGTAITFGKRESRDVVAALAWIKTRSPDRKIGIIGCSLGGASALLAPQPLGVDAVVLEAVYPRIDRAIENRVRLRVGAAAPLLTPLLLWQLGPRLHITTSDLEPIRSIAKLGAPVLIAAGSDDEHTTLGESEDLYRAASEPKEIWIVHGAKHQDLLAFDPTGYKAHVVRFLTDHLRGPLPYHAERLDKSAVDNLITERLAQKAPLVFGSNQGTTRCCDLGDPNLQFLPDHQMLAFGDGFVPWYALLSYEIAEDGKIVLHQSDDASRSSDLHDAYIYRYGPDLYLDKDSDTDPDFSFEPGTLWPFKAVNINGFALRSLVR